MPRHTMTSDQSWELIGRGAAKNVLRRVLLWGPPGTGKSYISRTAGIPLNKKGEPCVAVHPVTIHSDLPAAELRGHFIPTQEYDDGGKPVGNPILRWMDGPATRAWRDGGRLVLDEIHQAGDDCLSFLLSVLDDFATASLELGTTGEVIKPHKDFTCWATMNGRPEDLPPALQDRFPVTVEITQPHPAAIESLPQDLQSMAKNLAKETGDRHIGLRSFLEYARLREELDYDDAGSLVFGHRWGDLRSAIGLGAAADPR